MAIVKYWTIRDKDGNQFAPRTVAKAVYTDESATETLDEILGNRTYTEQNVVTNNESLTASINELDKAVATNFQGGLFYLSANISIATGVAYTEIPFDGVSYDDLGFKTADGVITIPAGVSKVKLKAKCTWGSATSVNGYVLGIRKNGSLDYAGSPYTRFNLTSDTDPSNAPISSAVINVVEGDVFTLAVRQQSGTTKTLNGVANGSLTWISIEVIE